MKSEVFSGSRFWAYFKYDFRQMWRNHVKAAIGIGLSGLILYVVWILFGLIFRGSWQAPTLGVRFVVFMLAFTALELYQTRTYGYLTERRKGSAWLLLPASGFEKWLSMIIMTLLVIPFFFFAVSLGVDAILSVADPTVGQPLATSFTDGLSQLNGNLVSLNATYETSWNAGVIAAPAIAGFCVNFLFFLLCGISFKRYKILWGFVIIFAISVLGTILAGTLGTVFINQDMAQDLSPAVAELTFRRFINWTTVCSWGLAALMAFLIYLRIKNLKH